MPDGTELMAGWVDDSARRYLPVRCRHLRKNPFLALGHRFPGAWLRQAERTKEQEALAAELAKEKKVPFAAGADPAA